MDVAKYIIPHFYEEGREIDDNTYEGVSNLKLQKLLSFCQAFALVRLNRPMFTENIYAWKYGPVVKEVYAKYRRYKSDRIPETERPSLGEENEKVVDEVLKTFAKYSAIRLMDITHSHKPWKDMEKKVVSGERDIIIKHEALKKYYAPMILGHSGH